MQTLSENQVPGSFLMTNPSNAEVAPCATCRVNNTWISRQINGLNSIVDGVIHSLDLRRSVVQNAVTAVSPGFGSSPRNGRVQSRAERFRSKRTQSGHVARTFPMRNDTVLQPE